MRVLKFLIAGGIGASVNLGIFHVLYVSGVQYLIASVIAVLVSMAVGFLLQKYWTFEERAIQRAPVQFVQYVGLAIGNLAINTGIVYVLIGKLDMYYLLAQAIAAATVATYSFFVYQMIIFKQRESTSEDAPL